VVKTIVLGLDGSENSRHAIPIASELAKATGARIVVAHIEERIAAKGDMPTLRADEDEVVARISEEVDAMAADGIDAVLERSTIVLGGPAHAISEIADSVEADVIVTGMRGHSAVPGLIIGSVTHRLLHISRRPVLAVPRPD
jgi:nucleotide-binding universal stress UspA family protein